LEFDEPNISVLAPHLSGYNIQLILPCPDNQDWHGNDQHGTIFSDIRQMFLLDLGPMPEKQ